jgi:hypothetical protein
MGFQSPAQRAPLFPLFWHDFGERSAKEWLKMRQTPYSSPRKLWLQGEPNSNIDTFPLLDGPHSSKTLPEDIHPDRSHSIQPFLSIVSKRPVFFDILGKDGCWG